MEDFSLIHMWSSMGWPVKANTIFMLGMSVWSFYVIVDRLIIYRKGKVASLSYINTLGGCFASDDLVGAMDVSKKHNDSPIAIVLEAGLHAYSKAAQSADPVDDVFRALDRVKEREFSKLRKGLGALGTIATIAPFVGLFGTVIGIINAFQLLKDGGGMAVVGPGIAEALVSTAVGLLVAIVAAMMFNYFTGEVEGAVIDVNDVSSEFIDFVVTKENKK